MGAQKNHLNEMVLLSNRNLFKFMGKKLIAILHLKFCFIRPLCFFCFLQIIQTPGLWETDSKGMSLTSGGGASGQGSCGGYCVI